MSGHRQAALAMHALGAHDQELILAELAPDDQALLRGYLNELRELGFDTSTLPAGTPAAADPGARLRFAPAAAMADVLGREPASLIAAVLRIDSWPWTADFLAQLTPAKAQLVRSAQAAMLPGAPARDRFLIDALGSALARHQPPVVAAPAAQSWLRKRISAWMR